MENGRSISIRLVYVIAFFAIIIAIIIGKNFSKDKDMEKVAENSEVQLQNEENTKISSINRKNIVETTSRAEDLTRIASATVKEETKYVSLQDVKISKDMDLTVRTGLSRDDFIKLIAGVKADTSGFFEENAGLIYDLCEEYSINEIFFCGLISAESGWKIEQNHRVTYNYISLMKDGKLLRFSSVEEGLREAASKLHTNYLSKGGKFYFGKTLAAVKTRFCPESSTWVNLVFGRMKQIIK